MTDQHDLFEPPDDDEPRLPADEVRRRIAAMKALLPAPPTPTPQEPT